MFVLERCILSLIRIFDNLEVMEHATLINKEEENLLWEHGVLGDDTPERLLHAVFYYNGKNI